MTRLALFAVLVLAAVLPANAQSRELKLFGQTFSLPMPASMIQFMSPTTEDTDTRVFTGTSKEPHPDLVLVSLIRKGAPRPSFWTTCRSGALISSSVSAGVNSLRCREYGKVRLDSFSVQSFVRCLGNEICLLSYTYNNHASSAAGSHSVEALIQRVKAYMTSIAVPPPS